MYFWGCETNWLDKSDRIFVKFTRKLIVLQPLWWRCVDCVIHHERDLREEQKYSCVARASNNMRDCDAWSLLLLVAAVRSFAHMPLGISDRNNSRSAVNLFLLHFYF